MVGEQSAAKVDQATAPTLGAFGNPAAPNITLNRILSVVKDASGNDSVVTAYVWTITNVSDVPTLKALNDQMVANFSEATLPPMVQRDASGNKLPAPTTAPA